MFVHCRSLVQISVSDKKCLIWTRNSENIKPLGLRQNETFEDNLGTSDLHFLLLSDILKTINQLEYSFWPDHEDLVS